MANKSNVSNVPLILGIIGGVLGLPGAVCAGACAAGFSAVDVTTTADEAVSMGMTFMWLGIIASLLGLLSAFLYKKNTKLWGTFMLLSGVMMGITLITFNILSLVVCALFIIGGIFALVQKKEEDAQNIR